MRFKIDELLQKLPLEADSKWTEGVWDFEPFEKRGVRLVFFAPRGTDHQTFHEEDEYYFIARGSAELVIGHESFPASIGDALFVEAGQPHHFENISADFATWAIFF